MPGGSNSQPLAGVASVTAEQAQTPTMIAPKPRRDLIDWWQTLAVAVSATLISSAALITEFASKRNAIAINRSPGQGAVRYDAGWPFMYAQVDLAHLSARTFQAALASPPRLRAIYWGALAIDTAIVALIFCLGLALIALLFFWAWRARPHNAEKKPSLRRFTYLTLSGFGAAVVWSSLSWWDVTGTSATMPTDAATLQALLQFPGEVLLAPGILQFLTRQWFEGDQGVAIALTGGMAALIESGALLLMSLVLPAAFLALLVNGSVRFAQWWQKQ